MTKRSDRRVRVARLLVCALSGVALNGALAAAPAQVDAPPSLSANSLAERGRYVARAANCAPCHTTQGGALFAGGVAFDTPFGTIYSTNITPDPQAGIGRWTLEDFRRALRQGRRPDGEHLYPVFPYTAFTKMTDEDTQALFTFLKTLPAVGKTATPNDVSFPFSQRYLLSVWNSMFLDEGVYASMPGRSAEWNRGAYLVEGLGHCSACHSPRNLLGAEKKKLAMTGGELIDRVPNGHARGWSTPNLTSSMRGLGLWPAAELMAYLKTGKNSFVTTFGPMNDVILSSTRYLSDQDLHAMALYLLSLPPRDAAFDSAPAADTLRTGKIMYNVYCGTCHLPTGLGGEDSAPRLGGGSLVVQAADPASLINVILYAPELPTPRLPLKWRPMEPLGNKLDDEEVAAVASYVRNAWRNAGGEVTVQQVDRQR